MKRILLVAAAMLISVGAFAQKNAFVNTELIFKSMPEYNQAIAEIDALAQQEQAKVDADFAKIAEMYERYQYQKQSLSETSRKQVEDNIIRLEQEATERQRAVFGQGGTLMNRRVEKLKPIQDRVFKVIDTISQQRGYDVVIDISNNPSVVYYNQANDFSEEVLKALGISK